jgi:NAD(P)H dehydrogenase (quinone)
MKKIAVICHSGYGHTAFFAEHVVQGASKVSGVEVSLLSTDFVMKDIESLRGFDGFIFGTPTYMGSVSAEFKKFMEATSGLWQQGALKNKWAGGFSVSGSPSGDKLATLSALAVFAAQHGMFWIGSHIMPETYQGVKYEDAANRLGSFLGAMAQASNEAPEKAFVPGDLKTARLFGERVARVVLGQL